MCLTHPTQTSCIGSRSGRAHPRRLHEQAQQPGHQPQGPPPGRPHQQQVVGDFLAWRMFQQARAALVTGGELWIVGNRHLGYHAKLKRLFRGVEQVAATPKFVVLKAIK